MATKKELQNQWDVGQQYGYRHDGWHEGHVLGELADIRNLRRAWRLIRGRGHA